MQGHFKHLHFKKILMVSWGPNLVFVFFSNHGFEHLQFLHDCNPKVGVHLGVIGLHPLHSPPFVRMCFTPKHTFQPHGPLHFTLCCELDARVMTRALA
jgi:hypothetical protein